ncbi:MAG: NUDIX domain-containing protein [Longimicrobiales bacterium]
MPAKDAVSFVVREPSRRQRLLIVLRPPDDPDLPRAWGLPAGSRGPHEDWDEAVRRAGRDKLGVELRVGALLNDGIAERADYTLRMRLYDAEIVSGEPSVPQPYSAVTQYRAWEWADVARLTPAAARGSLCCRLLLEVS